jgi:hypothetical protein
MTKPLLTKDIAYKAIQDFFIENPKPMVIFGTGTSCALDSDFGMPALGKELVAKFKAMSLCGKMKEEWDSVVAALNDGQDLENAMNSVADTKLLDKIVEITADFIIQINSKYAYPILSGTAEWPAEAIFRRLVSGLPETNRCLHIATTNYDMLAEYSFSKLRIPYLTGYTGGVCRFFEPEKAERAVVYMAGSPARNKLQRKKKLEKHIRLYKVHGSINTFELKDSLVENDEWIATPPLDIKRRMITPGMEKNIKIHERRRELIGGFDIAVFQHNAFLFLGFGFNDDQIFNNTLCQKHTAQGAPGLIITKDRNPRIDHLLAGAKRLWLVCKNPDGAGTLITSGQYNNTNIIVPDRELWSFKNFATEFLGG